MLSWGQGCTPFMAENPVTARLTGSWVTRRPVPLTPTGAARTREQGRTPTSTHASRTPVYRSSRGLMSFLAEPAGPSCTHV